MIESLDSAKILAFISPEHRHQLAQIEIFPTLGSTNSYLLDLAKMPQPSGYVCLAEKQTEGRGRQGKKWYSPRGKNIYCSLLWNFPAAQKDISHLSLAVGVMIVKALRRLGVAEGLQMKWPNDIYYNNRKLAGILIETIHTRPKVYPVIIGIGLNVNPIGHTRMTKAIGVAEIMQHPVSRNTIAGLLLDELIANLPLYMDKNFTTFFNDYTRYDMLRGKYIVIRTDQGEIAGIAQGINAAGELSIRDQCGKPHLFRCGEVSVVLNSD